MRCARMLRVAAIGACVVSAVSCGATPQDAPRRELPLLRLEARDFAFSAPARADGGRTRVRLVNRGSSWHEALITRLPDGVSADAYLREARAGEAFPVGALDMGGPGKVAAGDSSEVILDLEPGQYVVACWADAHVKAGMLSTLAVTGDARSTSAGGASEVAVAPAATGEVRLEDFRIVHDSATYRRGPNVVRVRNTGARPHDLTFYRLAEGRTARDFGTWYATRKGDAPAIPIGGMVTLAPGREGLMHLDLTPGRYFAACGTPEQGPEGTKIHAQMGMVEVFEIR